MCHAGQELKNPYQNVARQRAIDFGKHSSFDKPHVLQAPPSTIVSTTGDGEKPEDLIYKPRGFFADQFEVHTSFRSPHGHCVDRSIESK